MTALNFPDSPSNGDTYQGYTYNSTKSTWAKPDSPDPDARTAVYANTAALPTSGTAGDMAYVTATNRLYIWTGTGWYNIALINTNPTISGVSSSYTLAVDGTATTVTITASDPEGIPITYSIASDTSGNIATVAQGTGANTNVFTITPSTNTANAGNFSLTFRASDGVNIASAAASFTLQFKVQNQKYTTALITSVGANNAVNNSFVDSSTNSHTITAAGDAHQTTFSPYRHGGYSAKFDGTASHFLTDNTSVIGTGDWTWEAWVRTTDTAGSLWMKYTGGNQADGINLVNGIVNTHTDVGQDANTGSINIADGEWHYVVVERYNGTLKTFVDGTADSSVSNSENASRTGGWYIGRFGVSSIDWAGELRDLRFSYNTAEYQGSFTSSDIPAETVTARSSTTIILFTGKPYFEDGTATSMVAAPTSPYDAQEYSAADHGGSMYFDGSGDGISAPNHTSFDIGSGDFTIETWFYSSNPDNGYIFGKGDSTSASGTSFWMSGGAGAGLYLFHGGSYTIMQTGALPVNQWTHLAFVRNGTNLSTYINGTSVHSITASITVNTTSNELDIGYYPATAWIGNLKDFRFVKGTAVYTSAFTPPTAPLTAISGTSLLLKGTNAGIIDKAQTPRFVKLLGNTKSSTTQTKFLSSSMYFDGTGDYIEADDQDIGNFGTGDFTAEGWFYLTASPSNYITIAETRGSGGSTTGWVMAISAGDFYVYSGASIGAKGSAISSNTWYHWAFTRSGTDQKVFLNGTQTGSTYTTARNYTDNNFTIGAKHDASEFFTGYQSDVRITKGLARYTANFTPPTAALKG